MKKKLKNLIKNKEMSSYFSLVQFTYEQKKPTEHIVVTHGLYNKRDLILYIDGKRYTDFSTCNTVNFDYFTKLKEKETPIYSSGIKGLLEKLHLKTPKYKHSYIPKDVKVELFIYNNYSSKKNLEDLSPAKIKQLKKEAVRKR